MKEWHRPLSLLINQAADEKAIEEAVEVLRGLGKLLRKIEPDYSQKQFLLFQKTFSSTQTWEEKCEARTAFLKNYHKLNIELCDCLVLKKDMMAEDRGWCKPCENSRSFLLIAHWGADLLKY